MNKIIVYPKLPAKIDFGLFRYRGSGLANCMFIAARAYALAIKNGYGLINPTWSNLVLGPYLRGEKDKRHYLSIFKNKGISGFKKLSLLFYTKYLNKFSKKIKIQKVEGLGNYFKDLLPDQAIIKEYIESIVYPKLTKEVNNTDFTSIIGIHIRLGDYNQHLRTSLSWYAKVITLINNQYPTKYRFFIFSDGTDEELGLFNDIPNVERKFFGSAISDIFALSRCCLIIGSDSTFSGWGAFLGQVPIIFPNKHFGPVLSDPLNEIICNEDTDIKLYLHRVLKPFSI